MTQEDIKAINEAYVVELAHFVKYPLADRQFNTELTGERLADHRLWFERYKKDVEWDLVESNILKIHPNGNYEFLIEEYKWLFRETLENL